MEKKTRIPWDEYPEDAEDMELGVNKEHKNNRYPDVKISDIEERVITLNLQ